MSPAWKTVIVGGGIAGVTAARTLTMLQPGHRVLLINGEDRRPYKRTKISKSIAAGFERDAFALESEQWYADRNVTLMTGARATAIDSGSRELILDSGRKVTWEKLILATGSTAVTVQAEAPERVAVSTVRSAKDVEGLRDDIRQASRVMVVGAGVLGVEVADQLLQAEKQVVLVADTDRIMPKQLDDFASAHLLTRLEEHGAEVLLSAHVKTLSDAGPGSTAPRIHVELDPPYQGTAPGPVDLVIATVGVAPDTALARQTGLRVNRGVVTDQFLETSKSGIYAAGDVAEHPGGTVTYLWHAAEKQGEVAARNVLGEQVPYGCLPFRLKCEVFGQYYFSAGIPLENPSRTVTEVEEREGKYRRLYLEEGSLAGLIMINDGTHAKLYQKAVFERWTLDRLSREIAW